MGFPGGSVVKNPPANAGDMGSVPGLGISPEEGNGNLCQYSCLGNSIDTGASCAIERGHRRVGHDLETKQQQIKSIARHYTVHLYHPFFHVRHV